MRLKRLNKTKTGILSDLYNKNRYSEVYTKGGQVNAVLQLGEEFPNLFSVEQHGFFEAKISVNDGQLNNLLELLNYNQG